MRVQTFSRTQILQEFDSRCQVLAAKHNRGFKQEFEKLNDVGKDLPARAGDAEVNRPKNRYPYILPYDHCRVRLSAQKYQPHSDYINANFVPGGASERDFICTQGPLPDTVADFWRMVWEQNVRIVVMVTPLRHKDIVLCENYWPLEQGTVYHGLIQVTTLTRKQGPDYFVTTINLRQRDSPTDRIITHYYYPSWPDRGVPKDSSSLCAFTELVRQHLKTIPSMGPAVVHCSCVQGASGQMLGLLWRTYDYIECGWSRRRNSTYLYISVCCTGSVEEQEDPYCAVYRFREPVRKLALTLGIDRDTNQGGDIATERNLNQTHLRTLLCRLYAPGTY